MKVFVETARGSTTRTRYDETTFRRRESHEIRHEYPYDYGFIVGTNKRSADCIDCYVIAEERLAEGKSVECEPIGMIEMLEDGEVDHKVLATCGEIANLDIHRIDRAVRKFLEAVFNDIPGVTIQLGALLSREETVHFIKENS